MAPSPPVSLSWREGCASAEGHPASVYHEPLSLLSPCSRGMCLCVDVGDLLSLLCPQELPAPVVWCLSLLLEFPAAVASPSSLALLSLRGSPWGPRGTLGAAGLSCG